MWGIKLVIKNRQNSIGRIEKITVDYFKENWIRFRVMKYEIQFNFHIFLVKSAIYNITETVSGFNPLRHSGTLSVPSFSTVFFMF